MFSTDPLHVRLVFFLQAGLGALKRTAMIQLGISATK